MDINDILTNLYQANGLMNALNDELDPIMNKVSDKNLTQGDMSCIIYEMSRDQNAIQSLCIAVLSIINDSIKQLEKSY